MIIDHFSTYVVGGAPLAGRRLHNQLRRQGIDSRFHFLHADEGESLDDSYYPVNWPRRKSSLPGKLAAQVRRSVIRARFQRAMNDRPQGLESFTLPELARPTEYPTAAGPADVIQLHWVANMIDYSSFFGSVSAQQPVVWTLHDMNPMTGGCHYSNQCRAFEHSCNHCPQIANPGMGDLSSRNFQIKRRAFQNRNLHVVAPSRWLLEQAQQSLLLMYAKSFSHIPYGLDTSIHCPQDQQGARRHLGIDRDAFVIAFVAESIENHRKGVRHLLSAISHLADVPVVGLILGGGTLPQSSQPMPRLHQVGVVNNPHEQAILYSAADVLLLPSLADNLPLTGLEAMACGTPVVAFAVGGIPDYVRHQQTGLLVEPGDAAGLANQVRWLISHPAERQDMGKQSRKMMVQEYNAALQATRYTELYRDLLAGRLPARANAPLPLAG